LSLKSGHSLLAGATCILTACSQPPRFAGEELLNTSRQLVLVVVEQQADSTGWLYRYSAADGEAWRPVGEPIPASVGASGVDKTREGDKRAPSGAYPLTQVFGYAETPPAGLKMPYLPLRPETECVDDADSRFYNRVVNPSDVGGRSWNSSEMMRRDIHNQDDLYKLGLLVGYNPDAHRDPDTGKGAGSCIFLHIWRGPARPTVGCTALPEESLQALIRWLDPGAKPLLVQGTRGELERLAQGKRLPFAPPPLRLGA
jgi:D-alanyl-D-alanine dipeptidase